MFRKKSNDLPPEVRQIFAKLDAYLRDEAEQNSRLPPAFRAAVEAGANVDIVSGGTAGSFGRALESPIPVNGPLGEVLYLSTLLGPNGDIVIFHRLGSLRNIDVYEVVSLGDQVWDILYLDMYHPRKSRMAPPGYQLSQQKPLPTGTNGRVNEFPAKLPKAVARCAKRMLGMAIVHPKLRTSLGSIPFRRTNEQKELLVALQNAGINWITSE